MPKVANDNLHWRLRGPDSDGAVWLDWSGEGEPRAFNLGTLRQVQHAFARWRLGHREET